MKVDLTGEKKTNKELDRTICERNLQWDLHRPTISFE